MSVYFCFIIPLVTVLILFFFFKHKVVWWEFIIPVAISIIFILIAKAISIHTLTQDVEWLGGYVKEVRYYEDWNERVSCRHPIYCTSCSGSGKNRSCHQYVCGHHHPYDVDYHPEYWTAETTLGTYNISKTKYDRLVKQFGTGKHFVDLRRDYHTNDGDMYNTDWNGEELKAEIVTRSETYENRPKASNSVFHFTDVDTFDIKQYKLFDYPEITDQYMQKNLLGYSDPIAEKKLEYLNGMLGKPKQVRVYILVFRNQPDEAGHVQERYWQGGNKNEFVITIGVDDNDKPMWAYDFSWTEVEETKIETRDFIVKQDKLDLSSIIDFSYKEINDKWIRRDFHQFDYITIQPTVTQTIVIMFITLLINVGLGFWVVLNDIDEDSVARRKRYYR